MTNEDSCARMQTGGSADSLTAASTEQRATHTPGPWAVTDRGHMPWTNALSITAANGSDVAHTTRGSFFYEAPDRREGEQCPSWPNARLIAAAPDLLSALKRLRDLDVACSQSEDRAAWEQAHAAIAKAEGR